ncbi:TetR/AcrR family transcriptional regulator [Kribbella sancticallisti]|uniref:TetR/AcrR family transcriptional regulator n=1 Tax=Kribbella sancticallisti TaxID=460087 RepID=A0ABP4MX81_9ACTN
MARPRTFDTESAVAASIDVFRRRGYRGTSIRDLSTHLGLSLSSMYRAYGDKHGLFLRALDHYRHTESTQGCELFLESEATVDGLCRSLAAMVLAEEDPDDPAGCFAINTAAELGRTDASVVERTEAAFGLTRAGLRDVAQRLHENGTLRPDCEVDAFVDTLFTLILGWRLRVRSGHDPAAIRASIVAAVIPWSAQAT